MEEDIEKVKWDRDDYKRKMNMAYKQTAVYEEKVLELKGELELANDKLKNFETSNNVGREIMISQITDFNTQRNSFIEEIQELRNQNKNLKEQIK